MQTPPPSYLNWCSEVRQATKGTPRCTRHAFDPESEHFVPNLIKGPWTVFDTEDLDEDYKGPTGYHRRSRPDTTGDVVLDGRARSDSASFQSLVDHKAASGGYHDDDRSKLKLLSSSAGDLESSSSKNEARRGKRVSAGDRDGRRARSDSVDTITITSDDDDRSKLLVSSSPNKISDLSNQVSKELLTSKSPNKISDLQLLTPKQNLRGPILATTSFKSTRSPQARDAPSFKSGSGDGNATSGSGGSML